MTLPKKVVTNRVKTPERVHYKDGAKPIQKYNKKKKKTTAAEFRIARPRSPHQEPSCMQALQQDTGLLQEPHSK
jgi:hypothetical protein